LTVNLEQIESLREPLQALIDSGSRTNANKPQRYWYPLSMASYDVEEVLAAVDSLCSFRTTMWDKTAAFESSFAEEVVGGGEAIMVNSGSSADLLVAFALVNPADARLRPGDEVLVPSVTWPTQIWSSMMAGLRPRFVDTDIRTLNVDLDDLEAKIGPDTRAISLVHLMGNPCDMARVLDICARHDLVLFEDCCESLGASFGGRPVGSFGAAGAYSFFFSHHITTMEGGMIATGDEDLAELLRLLRAHGWARNARQAPAESVPGLDPRYTFLNWGFNVRPTELQAGFGQVQLGRWPGFRAGRAANAACVAAEFSRFDGVLQLMEETPGGACSWFGLPIMLAADAPFSRDDLTAHLEAAGVETRPIVAGNVTRHPAAAMFPELAGHDLPGADAVHDRGFYVGLHPTEDQALLGRLLDAIAGFVDAR
jgi:CDP-6-deoxy-D-xylo-4-hexulose-3-dehydrase